MIPKYLLFIVGLCVIDVCAQSVDNGTVTVKNRYCIEEPDVPPLNIPDGVCDQTEGVCTLEVCNLSNGKQIMCDTATDGGGWLVIQRRPSDGDEFNVTHADYVSGFGDITGSFWFGLENIHRKCPNFKRPCRLRIDVIKDNRKVSADYGYFAVSGAFDDYRLDVRWSTQKDWMAGANGSPFGTCVGQSGHWWYDASKPCPNSGSLNKRMSLGVPLVAYSEMKVREAPCDVFDVIFLLDSSDGVTQAAFDKMKDFAGKISDIFTDFGHPYKVRAGAIISSGDSIPLEMSVSGSAWKTELGKSTMKGGNTIVSMMKGLRVMRTKSGIGNHQYVVLISNSKVDDAAEFKKLIEDQPENVKMLAVYFGNAVSAEMNLFASSNAFARRVKDVDALNTAMWGWLKAMISSDNLKYCPKKA